MSVFELAGENPQPASEAGLIHGVVVGIVTQNEDPEGLARVKLKFPWLSQNHESHWARMATLMAGAGRGSFFLPEIDDEVLVAFEHGDMRFPYVVGMLWNGADPSPYHNHNGRNDLRVVRSRSGHELIFDDNHAQAAEKVVLHSKAGHTITLDDSLGREKISITDKTGTNFVEIDSVTFTTTVNSSAQTIVKDTPKANFMQIDALTNTAELVGFQRTLVRDKAAVNHLIIDSNSGTVMLSGLSKTILKDLTGLTSVMLDAATSSINLTSLGAISLLSNLVSIQALGALNISAAGPINITSGSKITIASADKVVLKGKKTVVI